MADKFIKKAMESVKSISTNAMNEVTGLVGGEGQAPARLTVDQQLDRYFNMTAEDFEKMRVKYGNEVFNSYNQRMQDLARGAR